MKLSKLLGALCIMLTPLSVNAYVMTDVKTYNQYFGNEVLSWEYDLADYGFVAGRDLLGWSNLRVEIRDPNYYPGIEWQDQPFVMLVVDQARYYARVGIEDMVVPGNFNEEGKMFAGIVLEPVWIGAVTLTLDIIPGVVTVPEPLPLSLLVIGLAAFTARHSRLKNK